MFCTKCGRPVPDGQVCSCTVAAVAQPATPPAQQQPTQPIQPPAFDVKQVSAQMTSRFSMNVLIVMGLLLLQVVFLFLPFSVWSFRGDGETFSGFDTMFGTTIQRLSFDASFRTMLELLVPLLLFIGVLFGAKNKRGLTFGAALFALYLCFINLLYQGSPLGQLSSLMDQYGGSSMPDFSAGVGSILSLIVWVAIAVFCCLEWKVIALIKPSAKVPMVQCPRCGGTVVAGSRFCTQCGQPFIQ